jgi:hypothetical protein
LSQQKRDSDAVGADRMLPEVIMHEFNDKRQEEEKYSVAQGPSSEKKEHPQLHKAKEKYMCLSGCASPNSVLDSIRPSFINERLG